MIKCIYPEVMVFVCANCGAVFTGRSAYKLFHYQTYNFCSMTCARQFKETTRCMEEYPGQVRVFVRRNEE